MTAPTDSSVSRDLILAARQGLQPHASGWLSGFGNMLSKELGEWFGTRRWIWQTLIWVSIINGFVAFLLFILPAVDPAGAQSVENPSPDIMGATLFFSFAIMAGSIGMVILAQDEIIHEKQSGTAAWVLSKPVARRSFILTKILSNLIGGLIFIVALPGIIILVEIYLATQQGVPILPYLAGAGIVLLTLFFYLTLVILAGVLFEQRGPVLGIAFGVMFGGLLISTFLPQISYTLPLSMDKIALAVFMGQTLPAQAVAQVISTFAWSIVFILLAVWRFERVEL